MTWYFVLLRIQHLQMHQSYTVIQIQTKYALFAYRSFLRGLVEGMLLWSIFIGFQIRQEFLARARIISYE